MQFIEFLILGGAVTCLPNHFQCNTSGNCIPELLKCDGIDHCDDGSDESEALCDEGRFVFWKIHIHTYEFFNII